MTEDEKRKEVEARLAEYHRKVNALRREYNLRIEDILNGIRDRKLRRLKNSIQD